MDQPYGTTGNTMVNHLHDDNRQRAEDRDRLLDIAAMAESGAVEAAADRLRGWADVLDWIYVEAACKLLAFGEQS